MYITYRRLIIFRKLKVPKDEGWGWRWSFNIYIKKHILTSRKPPRFRKFHNSLRKYRGSPDWRKSTRLGQLWLVTKSFCWQLKKFLQGPRLYKSFVTICIEKKTINHMNSENIPVTTLLRPCMSNSWRIGFTNGGFHKV